MLEHLHDPPSPVSKNAYAPLKLKYQFKGLSK